MQKTDFTISIDAGGIDPKRKYLTKEEKVKSLNYRWRIVWSCRDPETGLMKRMLDIKNGVNRLKTVRDRYDFLRKYRKGMIQAFNQRFHPLAFDQSRNGSESMTAVKALDYKYKAALLKDFLRKRGKLSMGIEYVTRDDILDYLDDVLKESSPGNRNTHRKVLSGMWTVGRETPCPYQLHQKRHIQNPLTVEG